MQASLIAADETRDLVQVPIQVGFSTLIINLVIPFVVSKPRRRRRSFTFIEEEREVRRPSNFKNSDEAV